MSNGRLEVSITKNITTVYVYGEEDPSTGMAPILEHRRFLSASTTVGALLAFIQRELPMAEVCNGIISVHPPTTLKSNSKPEAQLNA